MSALVSQDFLSVLRVLSGEIVFFQWSPLGRGAKHLGALRGGSEYIFRQSQNIGSLESRKADQQVLEWLIQLLLVQSRTTCAKCVPTELMLVLESSTARKRA